MAKIYDATTGKIIDKDTGAEVTMPSSSIQIGELQVRPASELRTTGNTNFDNTKTQFEQSYSDTNQQITEVYEDMVDVVISTEQPKHQKVADLWYKVSE